MMLQLVIQLVTLLIVLPSPATGIPSDYLLDTQRCYGNEFRCPGEFFCRQRRLMCDGWPDCDDGSDEDENKCFGKFCNKGEFQCSSNGQKKCHPNFYRCDGEPDCDDKSDETNCQWKSKRHGLKLQSNKRVQRNPFYFYNEKLNS